MKRIITAGILLCLMLTASVASAQAQLIVSDKLLKVVKVDEIKNRIEITGTENKPDNTTGYIYLDGRTKVHRDGETFDWKQLRRGWIIRVRGGVRFDMNVNARDIWVIETGPGD